MSGNLYYTPGQTVTFWLETRDGYGQVVDAGVPVIDGIYLPDFTAAKEYPQNMIRFDIGLYYFQFVLPRLPHHHRRWQKPGCAEPDVIGTYFVDISYFSPITQVIVNDYRQIIVSAPVGQFGVLGGGRVTCQF